MAVILVDINAVFTIRFIIFLFNFYLTDTILSRAYALLAYIIILFTELLVHEGKLLCQNLQIQQ